MSDLKRPSYYRRLPYRRLVEIERGEESGRDHFVAFIEEIPWIRMPGDSREEALLNLDEMFDDCIQALLDEGVDIPEPVLWPGPNNAYGIEQAYLEIGGKLPAAPMVPESKEVRPWTRIEEGNVEPAAV